jgi:hypothetical protein
VARVTADLDRWRADVEALVCEVTATGNVPLACDLQLTLLSSEVGILHSLSTVSEMLDTVRPDVPEALLTRVRESAAFAAEHDQLETEMRLRLVECEIEAMRGNIPGAKELAREVHARASTLRFAEVARASERTLRDGGIYASRIRELREVQADGIDGLFEKYTERELDEMADFACEQFGIPASRKPIVLDAVQCEQAGAHERRAWCRHLVVLEAAEHARGSASLYAQMPLRSCQCLHTKQTSAIPSRDWPSLIAAFKAAVCQECRWRSPKDGGG